ncbi:J-type co-chaperone JAC1, mitochondrial [Madurella mycetomatis]|uniref:J-type co-chaperone JAC1, mitochondrial n=1 Tax=Madurella mycetomatis TaxID=100816 RepID=A0A175VXX5_9PEZI|nr:J-type co-chaperone JAC1, mitochondrial [Madurella mycetomatis]
MRTSMMSTSGRVATYLCAACRRQTLEAVGIRATAARAAFSTAAVAPAAFTTRASLTVASPAAQKSIPGWVSQTRSTSTSTSPRTTSHSPPPSPSSPIPTYYALFPETLPDGPPPKGKFSIDVRALRREFLRLQAASHPDFHHSAAATPTSQSPSSSSDKSAARLRAETTSALINQAYKTLSSPLLRAQYLLRELHNVDLESDERGVEAAPDPELLMTVLEAREVIEEAEREEDLEEVRAANEGRIRESEEALGEALERGDVEAAKEEAVRLRYWVNIREGVDNWERGKPVVLQH